jgi:GNAT superfamily N-acetyltransferase
MINEISIRGAGRDDAFELAALLGRLGYPTDPATVVARLGRLEVTGLDQVLVAEAGEQVVGLASMHITPALLHREGPMARITAMVVDESRTRQGVGRRLVAAVEELARAAGCVGVEVSSNTRRADAHAFYAALGYTRSHELFKKSFEGMGDRG